MDLVPQILYIFPTTCPVRDSGNRDYQDRTDSITYDGSKARAISPVSNGMAMLDYSEITERKYIVFNGEPWEVLTSHVFRKQQRKPVNATKIKNLITGKVTEQSFHVSEKVEEAEINERDVKFLYENRGEYWFCEAKDPSKRFKIETSLIGNQAKFMKKDSVIQALSFGDEDEGEARIIGMKIPIKIDLKVIEAHPAVKGNTAQGGTKTVKLETGVEIQVPMFINEGEIIKVNSETGEYAERTGNSF